MSYTPITNKIFLIICPRSEMNESNSEASLLRVSGGA